MSLPLNEALIKAAEDVRNAVYNANFLESCEADTDGDGDCGRNCNCARIRRNMEPEQGERCYCGAYNCRKTYDRLHRQIFDRPMGMTD